MEIIDKVKSSLPEGLVDRIELEGCEIVIYTKDKLFFLDATAANSTTVSKSVGDSLGLKVFRVTYFIKSGQSNDAAETLSLESRLLEIALNIRESDSPAIVKCDMTQPLLKAFKKVNGEMRQWGVNFTYIGKLIANDRTGGISDDKAFR